MKLYIMNLIMMMSYMFISFGNIEIYEVSEVIVMMFDIVMIWCEVRILNFVIFLVVKVIFLSMSFCSIVF